MNNQYSLHQLNRTSRTTRYSGMTQLCLLSLSLLLSFGLSSLQLGAQENVSDPTSLNQQTADAVAALRRAAGSGPEQNSARNEADVRISGMVFSRHPSMGSGVVILNFRDEYFLAVEGQTIRTKDFDYTAEQINANKIALRDNRTGENLIWRGVVLQDVGVDDEVAFVEFNAIPLAVAAQALSYVTKDRIAVSSQAREIDVTLFLPSATTEEIVETLTLTHQLYPSSVGESDITRLQTVEEFARGSTNFQEERSKVFTLRFPNARDIALTIRDLFGDRVRLSERIDESEEPGEFLSDDLQQRLDRFDIIADRGQGIGEQGQGGGSGGSNSVSNRLSSSLRSRSNSSNSGGGQSSGTQESRELSEEDILSLEFIDTALLEAARDSKADIFVSLIDRLNKLLVRTRDQRTMDEITTLVEELDQPVQLVFLEIRVLRIDLDDGLDTGLNWILNDAGEFTGSGFNPANALTGDLFFQYVGNDVTANLNFLQSKGKLTVLGQPSLMTANNEVSRIFIGEQVPVLTGFSESTTVVTDSGNTVNFVTPEYEQEDVGSTILITANINDDDTVELRLLQEESQIVRDGADILGNIVGTGELTEISIDIVASQSVSGTFVAANNRTFAIGGLIQESIEDQRSQIPVLGDLPVVGRAFRNQGTALSRSELILLVRPTIISNPANGVFSEKVANDFIDQKSMHPKGRLDSGNLGVFEEADIIVPSVSEKNAPKETINALLQERYGPISQDGPASEAGATEPEE